MNKIDFLKLWEITKEIFLNNSKYQMKKIVTDFEFDNKFIWDFFSYLILEKVEWWFPIFYSTWWPFDIISKKEAYNAQIYQNWKILYNDDFKESTWIRTWIIAPLIAKSINVDLYNKKILIVWSWRLAKNGIFALLEYYPYIKNIFYTNNSWKNKEFEDLFKNNDIILTYVKNVNYGDYDYISFYTNATKSLLTDENIIKKWAFISSHISSTVHWEISDEIYKNWNVIIDWENNKLAMKDLLRAFDYWYLKEENILTIKEILEWKRFSQEKNHIILRSTWTPMQNIAILKYLLKNKIN
jgi:hypothetical protein